MMISNDTSNFLTLIYHTYIDNVKSGHTKSDSNMFTPSILKEKVAFSAYSDDSIKLSLLQLSQAGAISLDISGSFCLLDPAILYIECSHSKY